MASALPRTAEQCCSLAWPTGGPNSEHFAGTVENTSALVAPSVALLEVFKRISRQRDEATAVPDRR